MAKTKLSIITPVYNEEQNVGLFYSKATKVLKSIGKGYEILFIDDGSRDSTLKAIKTLQKKDKHVKFITFRRNFGKAAALSAGFEHANGDIIITMDGDLQDEPEEIPKFIAKIEEGYDLVNGWKFKRKDPLSKTIPSKFFNWLTSKMIGLNLHDFNCGFKAYRKEVVKEITLYGDMHRYIPAIAFWKGYRIAELPVKHNPRLHGKSKYGGKRLLTGFIDLMTVKYLTSYQVKPLQLFGKVGLLFILLGLVSGLYLVIEWFQGIGIGGRPLLILSVLTTLVGIQFLSIGLLGEMITSSMEQQHKSCSIKEIK
ncbi:MAG: glycosyltransferase family 2 protein [Candidatus Nanoarchaeia archaeon]|nr:glycosyltransferase family 2 protein [Candidatus Nanoarchaeia archaeon]